MITDTDINKLEKVFVTKSEFNDFKTGVDKRFEKVDKRLELVYKRLELLENSVLHLSKELSDFKNEMREFRDQTYKTLDWLVGAFKKFDEEHTILSARYSTINKTIDNHENRITSLEKRN